MKTKIYTITLLLILSAFCNVSAQKLSKRELKQKRIEILDRLKELVAKGQVDSMLNYVRDQNRGVDSSFYINSTPAQSVVMEKVIIDGDTLYVYNMPEFAVVDLQPYNDPEKDRLFKKLKWHVKKVYPYAVIAAGKLKMYNAELEGVESKRKRKKIMKKREKALKTEFEDVIKKMSQTSGRVLVKLIDRETGESTYDIIKDMRGGFKAWVYQGVGKLYGADLKARYDPKTNEEDEMIERVVQSLIAKKSATK